MEEVAKFTLTHVQTYIALKFSGMCPEFIVKM
jgi:hypothetical protein